MKFSPDCSLCRRARVRRPHGGGMVCPYCDLNEPAPAYPKPPVVPNKRPPSSNI